MIRAQIQFEEEQYERIRSLAFRERTSIAEMVRRLVRLGLEGPEQPSEPRGSRLLEIAGLGDSGLGDLAERHDDYLAEDFDS